MIGRECHSTLVSCSGLNNPKLEFARKEPSLFKRIQNRIIAKSPHWFLPQHAEKQKTSHLCFANHCRKNIVKAVLSSPNVICCLGIFPLFQGFRCVEEIVSRLEQAQKVEAASQTGSSLMLVRSSNFLKNPINRNPIIHHVSILC